MPFVHSTHRQTGIWMMLLCSYLSATALYAITVDSQTGSYWHSFKALKLFHPILYLGINLFLAAVIFWQGFSGILIWYVKLVRLPKKSRNPRQLKTIKSRVLWLHCIIGTPVAFWVMLFSLTGGLNALFDILHIDGLYYFFKSVHSLFALSLHPIRTIYVVIAIIMLEAVAISGLWGIRVRFRRRNKRLQFNEQSSLQSNF